MDPEEITTLHAKIEGLGFGAEGWTRGPQGRFVSVPHTLPGDQVDLRVGPFKRGRAWAQVLGWTHRSPKHVDPACPHYAHCSGCATRHMSLADEQEWKLQATHEILERYGPAKPSQITYLCADTREGHRARGKLRPMWDDQTLSLGLRSTRLEGDIEDVRDCIAQRPTWRRLMSALAEHVQNHQLRHVESLDLRTGDPGHALLLARLDQADDATEKKLLAFAQQWDCDLGIWLPDAQEPLMRRGTGALPITLSGVRVEVPWSSWTHPHHQAGHLLAAQVKQWLDEDHRFVLDLCAGVGTVSLTLAPQLEKMIAVDEDHRGLHALEQAAAREGLEGLSIRPGRLSSVLRKLRRELIGQTLPTAAIINPMRKPLGVAELRDIPMLGVNQILYLGPAPVSAAKDASLLAQMGFTLHRVATINLDPGTARFMVVLELRR